MGRGVGWFVDTSTVYVIQTFGPQSQDEREFRSQFREEGLQKKCRRYIVPERMDIENDG